MTKLETLLSVAIEPEVAVPLPEIGPNEYVLAERSMVTFHSEVCDGELPGCPTYEFVCPAGGVTGRPVDGELELRPQPLRAIKPANRNMGAKLVRKEELIDGLVLM